MNVPTAAFDGSLTKLDIRGITPADLVTLGTKGTGELKMLWQQALRARITGVRENNLYDLIMSRTTSTGKLLNEQKIGNRSFFLPYIQMLQQDFINVSAFVINSGAASSRAGTTVSGLYYPTHTREIVVANSPSQWASAIKDPYRYFLPGSYISVLNLSAGGAAQEPNFKVLAAERIDDDTSTVFIVPNLTATYFDTLTSGQKLVYQPTNGICQIGVNSISDYESYCRNHPAELSRRVIDFWFTNSRYTESYDDVTLEYLNKIKAGEVNEYLDIFRTLEMTEYNKLQMANYQKNMVNEFFYGQQIDETQTVETYQNLPKVEGRMGEFLEYKSRALGVKELLRRCNRVIDLEGAALDLNQLETLLLTLRRRREVDGGTVREIDIMCGHTCAIAIDQVMMGFYKAINRTDFTQTFAPQTIANGHLWNYRSYDLLYAQVRINVIVEPFFEDFKDHFTSTLAPRGNQLVILDWADIKRGVAKTASRMSNTPDINTDPTLACTIKTNVMHHRLESTMFTVMLQDPSRHLWIENFDLTSCPAYTYSLCSPTAE